ncbi:MAG: mechanosensitive ion channel [Promethearchaeota archaeon]|nr:MAG: mechanosensitive ion channel [Candidatus Lokiarchaeota archaeon]
MALFDNDLIALIVLLIAIAGFIGLNKLLTTLMIKTSKITIETKNKVSFVVKVISVAIIVYLAVEGFPIFQTIPEEMRIVLTGAISTATAFLSSEIFVDFLSGILLFIIDPFDIGHVVKIQGKKGVVKSITLTKIIIETFNAILVEIKNSQVIDSKIVNYTVELEDVENFGVFKKRIQAPQDRGKARIDLDLDDNYKGYEEEFKQMFEEFETKKYDAIHSYTFRMGYQYNQFRIRLDLTSRLCEEYIEYFGFRPRFHVVWFGNRIELKFQILTFDMNKLKKYQPKFAHGLYEISMGNLDF